jgi:hypothetical protein
MQLHCSGRVLSAPELPADFGGWEIQIRNQTIEQGGFADSCIPDKRGGFSA